MDILGGQNNRSSFTLTSLNDYHRRFDPVITRTLSLTNDLSTLDVMAKTFIEVSTPFLEEIPPKLIERLTKSDFSQIHEIAEQWLEISDERTYQAQTDQEPNDVIIHLGRKSALAEAACCIDPTNVNKENLFYFLISLSSVVVDPQKTMSKQIL